MTASSNSNFLRSILWCNRSSSGILTNRLLMKLPPPFLTLVVAMILLAAGNCFSQAISPLREWTNNDGKKIRAELLAFGNETQKGLVHLRLKGGAVYKVKPETLTREDQAIILKAKFDKLFRSSFSNRMEAHFFYSKKIPADEQDENTIAYIGNDIEDGWIRLQTYLPSRQAEDGVALMAVRTGADSIRVEFDEDDIEFDRRYALLDVSLTNHADEFAELLADPSDLKFIIESSNGSFSEIELTHPEKLALQEVSQTFQALNPLTTDHVWWTTFTEMERAEFDELRKKDEEPPEPVVPAMPKEKEPILPSQPWTMEGNGNTFTAAVMGFDREKVLFRLDSEKSQSIPLEELSPSNREVLAARRLELSLYQTWHPHDEKFAWNWPLSWTEPDDRISKQAILFVIDRETGEPGLFLQLQFNQPDAPSIASCRLQGKSVAIDLAFPVKHSTLKLRSSSRTTLWLPISEDAAEILVVASPALEGFTSEIDSPTAGVQKGEFSDKEFEASLEAIEIYRAWKSLVSIETPQDPPSTTEPVSDSDPETDTQSSEEETAEPE